MTEYFNVINEYLGWGDPAQGGLWFVGLEEAGESKEKDIIELRQRLNGRLYEPIVAGQLRKNYETYCSEGKRYTTTNLIMSKIVIHSGFEKEYEDPREYWFGKLFQEGSKVFQSNLYPLGKNSWDGEFPSHYKDLFGFENNKESRKSYEKTVSEKRWKLLKDLWDKRKPSVTICFGKIGWTTFKEIFDLQEPCDKKYGMEFYEQQRVVLTPFFVSHQMSEKRIEKLSETLKKWLS